MDFIKSFVEFLFFDTQKFEFLVSTIVCSCFYRIDALVVGTIYLD